MPTEKITPKKPNILVRFFSAIGRGIAGFFTFIWELIWTIITFIYDLIIKIIHSTMKCFLIIWGFILATILVIALVMWLVTVSVNNLDGTNVGAKLADKIEPAITKISEQINEGVLNEIEMNKQSSKEDLLKNELKRLQDARINDLQLELDSIEAE